MKSLIRKFVALAGAGSLALGTSASAQYNQMSQRCVTPQFWCVLPMALPVGSACYCATPNGPVYGRVG